MTGHVIDHSTVTAVRVCVCACVCVCVRERVWKHLYAWACMFMGITVFVRTDLRSSCHPYPGLNTPVVGADCDRDAGDEGELRGSEGGSD